MVSKNAVRKPSLGAQIDQLWAAREEKRRLEVQVKEVEAKITELQEALFAEMEEQGLDAAKGTKASLSIGEEITADVVDWDLVWADIGKKKLWHLVIRRLNNAAYREHLEAGKKLSGAQPFTKRKLNLRTL